jgi:hypothetical protein
VREERREREGRQGSRWKSEKVDLGDRDGWPVVSGIHSL